MCAEMHLCHERTVYITETQHVKYKRVCATYHVPPPSTYYYYYYCYYYYYYYYYYYC